MGWERIWDWVKRIFGFLILFLASIRFLGFMWDYELDFALAIAFVLLVFAWTDYSDLIIYTPLAFGAMVGFFLGNLKGMFYSIPTGLAFLVFAYLISSGREKEATLTFLASLPLALANSYFFPVSSPVDWSLVGLMVGLIENAVIEEMADGDIFIIALYFMVLGPFAFIPVAFQIFVGMIFYERKLFFGGSGYPVGPAMFVVSVPLFILFEQLTIPERLPAWLFYAYFHGVTNPSLGILGAIVGAALLPKILESAPFRDIDFVGGIMGATAGAIAAILTLAIFEMLMRHAGNSGNLSSALYLLSLVATIIAGLAGLIFFSKVHYEGTSSINWALWTWGLNLGVIALSISILPEALSIFPGDEALGATLGILLMVAFCCLMRGGKYETLLDKLWLATLLVSTILTGMWVGFGIGWAIKWIQTFSSLS